MKDKRIRKSECELSAKAYNALHSIGVEYIDEAKSLTKSDILGIKGVGTAILNEIEQELYNFNVSFKDSSLLAAKVRIIEARTKEQKKYVAALAQKISDCEIKGYSEQRNYYVSIKGHILNEIKFLESLLNPKQNEKSSKK